MEISEAGISTVVLACKENGWEEYRCDQDEEDIHESMKALDEPRGISLEEMRRVGRR